VLFQVPFASTMSDCDLALLARLLDLSTHMCPKMHPDPNSPGVARLDHFSGLFLKRGGTAGQWVLEARTWGQPGPQSVNEWNLLAAGAELDPHLGFRLHAGALDTLDQAQDVVGGDADEAGGDLEDVEAQAGDLVDVAVCGVGALGEDVFDEPAG
jgi:hypothetical protein